MYNSILNLTRISRNFTSDWKSHLAMFYIFIFSIGIACSFYFIIVIFSVFLKNNATWQLFLLIYEPYIVALVLQTCLNLKHNNRFALSFPYSVWRTSYCFHFLSYCIFYLRRTKCYNVFSLTLSILFVQYKIHSYSNVSGIYYTTWRNNGFGKNYCLQRYTANPNKEGFYPININKLKMNLKIHRQL